MSFAIKSDTLSPELARLARECGRPKPILEAMGLELVSTTQRAFNDESLRATPWAEVKKAEGAPLKRSGALWHSIRIVELGEKSVKVGTDRPYAAVHQFGGKGPYTIHAKPGSALFWPGALHPVKSVKHPGLPARPFFPFDSAGNLVGKAVERIRQAAERAIRAIMRR